ncbi:metal ABC transporter substrate-binding protein [Acuticoccus mangrovi]|uniref:Metal ABC transporter substrate-binding protein n=1 Tax=Acuticoccus mangrovi TaxID=2796142 RepID=A0A934IPC0_9HYPH|nr:metal ABC transporter substrate-binding protein [Acuticoccus mangrovi]MBJ3775590.1 metal ABC transporter substrate-binding protein [Acuticoccus mangrovi]
MRRILLAAALAVSSAAAQAADLSVVATFSILGDMVKEVGGERVAVTTLVGPDGDTHMFQPTPIEARTLGDADVVVVNGLGLEGWIERLIDVSGFDGRVVVASQEIAPRPIDGEHPSHGAAADGAHAGHRHDHGVVDPHAWQDLANGRAYVTAIAEGLAAADPEGAATYAEHAASYRAELAALESDLRARIAALPAERRSVVTSHDAFGYFKDAYGIAFVAPQGVSTDADPSARDVAALIRQIRDEGIGAVFLENISDARLIRQIASETDARIGGRLFSDALSGPDGDAPTYLEMMRHNIDTLTAALGG